MAAKRATATEAELAVLDVLWNAGEQTAREITARLYPAETAAEIATVQKLLQRLEEKRFVRRDRGQHVHRFAATIPRSQFAGEQLSNLAEKLSGGSLAPLLMHLVQNNRLSDRELDELRALLAQRRQP